MEKRWWPLWQKFFFPPSKLFLSCCFCHVNSTLFHQQNSPFLPYFHQSNHIGDWKSAMNVSSWPSDELADDALSHTQAGHWLKHFDMICFESVSEVTLPIAVTTDCIWLSPKLVTSYLIRLVTFEIGFFIRIHFICSNTGKAVDSSQINLCLDQMDHPYRNIRNHSVFW